MGMKIRPVSRADRKQMYGTVKNLIDPKSNVVDSVESVRLFGKPEHSNGKEFDPTYTRMAAIDFALPVLNKFLAGKECPVLKAITDDRFIPAFARGDMIYDVVERKYITPAEETGLIYDPERYIIGAQYIQSVLNDINVSDSIVSYISKHVSDMLPPSEYKANGMKKSDGGKVGNIVEGDGAYWVIDEYYFNPTIQIEDKEGFQEILNMQRPELVAKQHSRLTMLLALKNNPSNVENLRNQVMTFLPVLPRGYRESVGTRRDKLTKAYNRVVSANERLRTTLMYTGAQVSEVRLVYKQLLNEVDNVMVAAGPYESKDYKPLKDRLGGKEGLIRDRMLGVRIDYTGRSVIIVDPYMSMDTVGLPKLMVDKLMELHVLRKYRVKGSNKAEILVNDKKALYSSISKALIENMYVAIGRQPTLYRLGIQGFKVKEVEGDAIKLSPLIVPAFNADFDGDQMAVNVPQTPRAVREAKELMAVTNNLYLPRSGDCHIAPRQEILYGLWKCVTVKMNEELPKVSAKGFGDIDFIKALSNQEISIKSPCSFGGRTYTAGYVGVKICLTREFAEYRFGVTPLTKDESVPEGKLSESWFKVLMGEVGRTNKDTFVSIINNLVILGTSIANIYPPTVDVLGYKDFSSMVEEFDNTICKRERLYQMGLETDEAYASFYDKEYSKLSKKVEAAVKESVGEDSGFLQMAVSGARGSMSNIMQIFGMKGRTMKNSNEAFNAVMPHSLVCQLTGLEHFIMAYGSRQGLIDKVVATYKPGYLTRQLVRVGAKTSIVSQDCGTDDGLLLDYNFLARMIGQEALTEEDRYNNSRVKKYFYKLVLGRYVVGIPTMITTEASAESIYKAYVADEKDGKLVIKPGVKLRSPITCKNPCCVKCYGLDLGKQRRVKVGMPCGFEGATGISEPGTQLIMKNFQSGGVAGIKNLTSSFDTTNDYFHLVDFRARAKGGAINYDYISPYDGDVRSTSLGDGTKLVGIYKENEKGKEVNQLGNTRIVVYDGIPLKQHVSRGESIQVIEGDHDINEIQRIIGPDEAQRYLALKLYSIYEKEVFVNIKHFEMMVASMTLMLCLKGNKYFNTGRYYTLQEYYANGRSGAEFSKAVYGIKNVPFLLNDMMASMLLEDLNKSIVRNIVTSGYDELKDPAVRLSLGLNIGIGSDVPGFMGD